MIFLSGERKKNYDKFVVDKLNDFPKKKKKLKEKVKLGRNLIG